MRRERGPGFAHLQCLLVFCTSSLCLSFLMKTEEIKKGKNCTDLYVIIIIIIFALQTSSVRIKSLN